ncbi:hypothetical protein BO85DRAFT_442568 [Aspergillus piperis CBS 112811]|uniref:Uncharacterized protein n=1 Tax=Aspergillus piperis CBS 112811 TaxID=1448313 RepID=A0A8G1QRJ2_9EURO|nr:hypothetical protein BO85DRAFT_442568 [Aspergillus piperis CBS 112811]RAH53006.1 hypothetical protein BO85DRAFT_442568 [Aspergillus piperis CBS 112811]
MSTGFFLHRISHQNLHQCAKKSFPTCILGAAGTGCRKARKKSTGASPRLKEARPASTQLQPPRVPLVVMAKDISVPDTVRKGIPRDARMMMPLGLGVRASHLLLSPIVSRLFLTRFIPFVREATVVYGSNFKDHLTSMAAPDAFWICLAYSHRLTGALTIVESSKETLNVIVDHLHTDQQAKYNKKIVHLKQPPNFIAMGYSGYICKADEDICKADEDICKADEDICKADEDTIIKHPRYLPDNEPYN